MKTIKIGYFADGPWSHGALDYILDSNMFVVEFICARFDSPDKFLEKRALESNIDFFVLEKINEESSIAKLVSYGCDILFLCHLIRFLKTSSSTSLLGTINCHAGMLPFYRGRNIPNWALITDEKEFGISVHYVDDGIDTGDLILQRSFPITDGDDYSSLLSIAYRECPIILFDALKLIYYNEVVPIKQNTIHPIGTIFSQRKIGDEFIDWTLTSREIFNFVRGITTPGPCAQAMLDDCIVYIKRVEFLERYSI